MTRRNHITLLADLHGRTPQVDSASRLVLLAGDIGPDFGQRVWLNNEFMRWLDALPCPCVAIPGNHDKVLAAGDVPEHRNLTFLAIHGRPALVTVAGVSIYGNPNTLDRYWAFGAEEEDFANQLAYLPVGVDFLLCHSPPFGTLDIAIGGQNCGVHAIADAIRNKQPKVCVFGHIHESRGRAMLGQTLCINASMGMGGGPWQLRDEDWMKWQPREAVTV